jgi:hypothetical protein
MAISHWHNRVFGNGSFKDGGFSDSNFGVGLCKNAMVVLA